MSRVLRLRGVDIGFDVYGERQGESSRKRRDKFAAGSGSRKAAEPGGKISVERRLRCFASLSMTIDWVRRPSQVRLLAARTGVRATVAGIWVEVAG